MAFLEMLKNRIVGGCRLDVPDELCPDFLNICMEKHLPYSRMCPKDGFVAFDMTYRSYQRLKKVEGFELSGCTIKYYGIPFFVARYRHRYGLFAGIIVIFIMVLLSCLVVWDIRVTGNSSLTEAQVEDELRRQGFCVGSFIHARDVDIITNKLLSSSEKISWMSINFRGNVAEVQIREKEKAPKETFSEDKERTNTNIVAKKNGIIERLEVLRGRAAVKEGDAVNEGDLLITGIIETKHGELRTESALGRVFAVTNHTFNVEIPLEYEKKVKKDSFCNKKSIIFFSKRINIYRNSGKPDTNCVKIEEEEFFSFFGLPPLPFGVFTERQINYSTEMAKRSYKEASDLAFFELNNLISDKLSKSDILQKNIQTEITDKSFILVCDIICSENIAKELPFEES